MLLVFSLTVIFLGLKLLAEGPFGEFTAKKEKDAEQYFLISAQ